MRTTIETRSEDALLWLRQAGEEPHKRFNSRGSQIFYGTRFITDAGNHALSDGDAALARLIVKNLNREIGK
jgi:hypothetical protein